MESDLQDGGDHASDAQPDVLVIVVGKQPDDTELISTHENADRRPDNIPDPGRHGASVKAVPMVFSFGGAKLAKHGGSPKVVPTGKPVKTEVIGGVNLVNPLEVNILVSTPGVRPMNVREQPLQGSAVTLPELPTLRHHRDAKVQVLVQVPSCPLYRWNVQSGAVMQQLLVK